MSDDNMDRILETAHARLGLSQASQIWMDDVHLLAAVEALKKALGNDDDLLLDRLNSHAPIAPRRHVIPCQLIVRGSSAPPSNRS